MKNRIKKRYLSLILTMMMAFALTACSSSSSTETKQSNSQDVKSNVTVENTSKKETQPSYTGGELKVHFLNVGQGLSVLVQSEGQTLIYDGGDRKTSSFVVSYLKEQQVESIDYLVSSHYDSDHMAGLIGCLKAFDVKNVISSDYVHDSQLYTSFVNAVEDKGLQMQHPSVGTTFQFGSASFEILAPSSINPSDSNNNSVAIKVTNGNNSIVLTGDAESPSEAAMCSSGIDLSCDVLVLGHHGSATATSWDFLQATIPEYAVVSCGTDNQYGHPDKDTMDKLQSMGIQVYRTDKQGTITVTSDGTNLTWSTEACNDYSPGDSNDKGTQQATQSQPTEEISQPETQPAVEQTPVVANTGNENMVWVSETGSKYHRINNCGRMNPNKAVQMSQADAEARGLEPCKKCY